MRTRFRGFPARNLVFAAAVCAGVPSLSAQESLLGGVGGGAAAAYAGWSFARPIPQGAIAIRGLSQVAVPFSVRFRLGDGWSFEVGGAVAAGRVEVDSGSARRSLSLTGLTDFKVRLSRGLGDGRTLLTAGVNLPTGTTGLDGSETMALQAIAAPGLQMPVSALGLGPGATLGLIRALEEGDWAVALGASAELRTEYTAVELALASGAARTTITPGTALHVTVGADRSIGDHRLGLQLLVDAYTKDKVVVGLAGGANVSADYSLGPQLSAIAHLDLSAGGWRDAALAVSVRHRTPFSDGDGKTVSGSAGTYADASIGGVRGGPTGRGLILATDARYYTGFSFTDALIGAKHMAVGVTIGAELPASARSAWRVTAHPQYGSFDTGRASSGIWGIQLTAAYAARTGAR